MTTIDAANQQGVTHIDEARSAAYHGLAGAGDWLTGAERVEAWAAVRDARTNGLDRARREAVSPFAVEGAHEAGELLSAVDVEVVHRVATDPGRLTPSWATETIAEIGEERYTELVALTAIVQTLDTFDAAVGDVEATLPTPIPGDPSRTRPADVGHVGAWVSQSTGATRANVSRTFSLVPQINDLWRGLVDSHYSRGAEFLELVWDRALSRPQVELVAARTTALNECFY